MQRQELLQNSSNTGMLEAAGLRQDTRHSGCGELQEAERMQAGQRQGEEQNNNRTIVLDSTARERKQGSTQQECMDIGGSRVHKHRRTAELDTEKPEVGS